ncbi:MAG: hypothetical protein ACPG7F_01710 [Aggregatilineales bacterium]
MTILIIIAIWVVASVVIAPLVGRFLAGRKYTHQESVSHEYDVGEQAASEG